jgi:hypothetical protein
VVSIHLFLNWLRRTAFPIVPLLRLQPQRVAILVIPPEFVLYPQGVQFEVTNEQKEQNQYNLINFLNTITTEIRALSATFLAHFPFPCIMKHIGQDVFKN